MEVKEFWISLLPYEKIIYILQLLDQDYPSSSPSYIELLTSVKRYFPNIEECFENETCNLANLDWLEKQFQKNIKKNPTMGDIEKIYNEIKENFFQYIANHFIVREDGYINSMLISAYKKACKILINEGYMEKLILYIEGLRNCEGILKKEFLEKYRKKA